MNVEIKAAGIVRTLPRVLEVYQSVTFEGSGDIRASAISRESKNRYKVYIITTTSAWRHGCKSMKESVEYLERWYLRRGSILS